MLCYWVCAGKAVLLFNFYFEVGSHTAQADFKLTSGLHSRFFCLHLIVGFASVCLCQVYTRLEIESTCVGGEGRGVSANTVDLAGSQTGKKKVQFNRTQSGSNFDTSSLGGIVVFCCCCLFVLGIFKQRTIWKMFPSVKTIMCTQ